MGNDLGYSTSLAFDSQTKKTAQGLYRAQLEIDVALSKSPIVRHLERTLLPMILVELWYFLSPMVNPAEC